MTAWAALALPVFGVGTVSAAVPGDPWRIGAHADEMSSQSEPTAEAMITAGDGHRFQLTAKCETGAGLAALTLEVLAPNNKFQILENTTVNGSDLFGYSANTQTRVGVRLKFDEGDVITAQVQAPYTNDFTMIFPDMNQSKGAFGPGASGNGPDGALKGILGFAMMFGGTADVNNLITNNELRIQPTLADGETPVIRVPLTLGFKRFVAGCFAPPAPTGLSQKDFLDRLNGTFRMTSADVDLVIRDGQMTMMGRGRPIKGPEDILGPNNGGIQGDTIILDRNGATLKVVNANTLVLNDGGLTMTFKRIN